MNRVTWTCVLVAIVAFGGLGPAPDARAEWTAERVKVVEGFQTPESVAVDPASGTAYVSNVVADLSTAGKGPWDGDGQGFISRLKPGGQIDVLKWRQSTKELPLNGPKGSCIGWGQLRVADITRIVTFKLEGDEPGRASTVRGAKRLNDMAADAAAIYVSDTAAGNAHRFARGDYRLIKAPPGINGITLFGGKMYGVSWTLHDVFELDPTGRAEPKPFGLAEHFQALDGIEVLDDGTILVSDFPGGKVSTISPDRKTVHTLLETTTPADIGLDRKRRLLYVPLFQANRVEVYQLKKQLGSGNCRAERFYDYRKI